MNNEAKGRTVEERFLEEYARLGGEGQREEELVEAEERALGRFVGHHDEGTVEDLRRLLPERRPPVDADPTPPVIEIERS